MCPERAHSKTPSIWTLKIFKDQTSFVTSGAAYYEILIFGPFFRQCLLEEVDIYLQKLTHEDGFFPHGM